MPSRIPVREVCCLNLRREFNRRDVVGRAARGLLREVRSPLYPTPASRGQPPGTMTEKIEYQTARGIVVAIAICFRRPDGSIGASGKPDPKWFRRRREIWIPVRRLADRCQPCH
jgi:hypothetical protein